MSKAHQSKTIKWADLPSPPGPLLLAIFLFLTLRDSSAKAVRLSVVSSIAFGIGMIQVDEYLAAIVCWLAAGTLLIIRAVHWQGIADHPIQSAAIRSGWVVAAVVFFIFLFQWTEIKRGDKPWSIVIFNKKAVTTTQSKATTEAEKPHRPIIEPIKPMAEGKPSLKPESPVSPADFCSVVASVSSNVVSRVYYRDTNKIGEQYLIPTSQELFYEWKAVLSATSQANNVFLEIHNLTLDDRISIIPTRATLSEPQERWYSGFREPHRSKPDYFVRIVKITDLSPLTSSLTIVVRRFLPRPLLGANDIIKIRNFITSNCQAKLDIGTDVDSAERLQSNARILLEEINQTNAARKPVPNRPDPGDLKDQEIEGTIEFRCKNSTCSEVVYEGVAARLWKSPADQAREEGRKKILALKKDLEELFCMEGPTDDLDPTKDSQTIKMCDKKKNCPQMKGSA